MIRNIQFRNIGKIFPKNKISRMRTEDLISLYKRKQKFMSKKEKKAFNNRIFGKEHNLFPLGHEVFVERNGGKLRFTSF